ncbi:MAG: glycosyltransferase family 1 protein, partial [Candidatus Electrothrix sp. AR4]|nr:glycosyltransferase family 1 protein [Candidatus Electrothrix sp. AR4]
EITWFNKLICENGVRGVVCVLGFVPDAQLQALIKGAEFLIFPSLFEGFGMPILEAMTLGCPVISSNAGSLPEVGGDAAVYFDPRSEDNFIALLDGILKQKGLDRNCMIQKGFVNCQRFSWQKTCDETVAVYNELTGQ